MFCNGDHLTGNLFVENFKVWFFNVFNDGFFKLKVLICTSSDWKKSRKTKKFLDTFSNLGNGTGSMLFLVKLDICGM
jgi:hypothetical protein